MRHTRKAIPLAVLALFALAPLAARAQQAQVPPYGAPIGVETARRVAAAAISEAKKNGWNVAAAVVDSGGHLVFFERSDGTQFGSVDVSIAKARTSAAFRRPTKAIEDVIAGGRTAYLGLPGAVPLEGGLPLVVDGKLVGAVGVSGGTSQQDGVCAQAGAATIAPVSK